MTQTATKAGEDAQKHIDEAYAAYLTHRELLVKQEFDTSRDCDRWTLTVSAGALGLSFTFLKDVVSPSHAHYLAVLGTAWVLLVLSVASTLVSVHLGHFAYHAFREALDKTASKHLGPSFWDEVPKAHSRCWQTKACRWAAWLGATFAVFGLLALLAFGILNYGAQGARNGEAESSDPARSASATATNTEASATATSTGGTATATAKAKP